MEKSKNQINIEDNNKKNNERKNFDKFNEKKQNNPLNKEKKFKGFVRVFRGIIKKKDEQRKDIISNRFRQWIKQSLIGSKIKKTIMVRISISREKEPRGKHRNKFKFEKENEKEKPKSVNKKIVKSISKYHDKSNDIKVEKKGKIKNQENGKKYNKNKNNEIKNINTINNKETNKINNYKVIDEERSNNYNIMNLKYNNNQIIEISDIKPKQKGKINTNDKIKSIYPKTNLKNKFTQMNNSSKKNSNINSNNYKKVEPKYVDEINKNQSLNYDNVSIIYSSSSKKDKSDKLRSNNIKSYNLNNSTVNDISNEKNPKKGYYQKYDGYHDNKKNIYTTLPIKTIMINLTDKKEELAKQGNLLNKNKNKTYKKDLPINNSFSQENNSDNNIYKINAFQKTKDRKINKNNESDANGKYSNYTSRRSSNSNYSQKITKPALNTGVSVIQHYSGRKK